MYITPEELLTIVDDYQLSNITTDDATLNSSILAAEGEATSYLSGRFDTTSIFSATGDERNATLVEHIKSIALYYLMRKNNVDINADNSQTYYKNAVEWLKMAGGVSKNGVITPDLPLITIDGEVVTTQRMGSNPKFNSYY